MASILRLANLCKTYKITNTQKQDVLKGVDLELSDGELVALLGESGCGKSTLINIIGGLDTDYTGSVVIKGKFIRDFTEGQMDDYRKKRIGLIFQNYNLIPTMTLQENVEIAMHMNGTEAQIRHERALDLLDLVGLKAHASKYPNQLSGGQKQRVAIARALANNPPIILADEPTGALDKEASRQVMSILKKISQMGKLVIVVTHSMTVASECSRIVKMDDGVIIEDNVISAPAKNKYEKYIEEEPKYISTKELANIAVKNVKCKKSRNLLVSMGIAIGIAALILILALSKGITNYVKAYYEADIMSTTLITTKKSNGTISNSDIAEIKGLDGVSKVIESHYGRNLTYTYGDSSNTLSYLYEEITDYEPEIIYGKDIKESNETIIDLDFALNISSSGVFGVLGQSISLTYKGKMQDFKIVGIYDNADISSLYISKQGMSEFSTSLSTNYLYIKAKDVTYLEALEEELQSLEYSVTVSDNDSSVVLDYIDLGTTVLMAVAGISTVVSAIMIIIVLYISVIERTDEIGILRSIGARKKDILKMFMTEATILGTLGGVFGLGFAYIIAGITNLVSYIASGYLFISFNPIYYIIGLLISVIVSLLAGIAPAKKASDLDPIEALRLE